MKATIQKWGNSLGIRIPKVIADELNLQNGSVVELFEDVDKIVIQARRKLNLSDMLSGINEENLHAEIGIEGPSGKEVW